MTAVSTDSAEAFRQGISRFLKEARNMAKFAGKPNFVYVYDFFEENGTAYIIMEFIDGVTISD